MQERIGKSKKDKTERYRHGIMPYRQLFHAINEYSVSARVALRRLRARSGDVVRWPRPWCGSTMGERGWTVGEGSIKT